MNISSRHMDQILAHLALTDNQRKVYLFLFKKRRASVKMIAEATGLNRTTVYTIVEQFVRDELFIRESPRFGAKILLAHPGKLVSLAERRTIRLQQTTNQLLVLDVLPELVAHYKAIGIGTRISQFEGLNGVEQMYEDVLVTFAQNPQLERDSLIGCTNLKRVIANLPTGWVNAARKRQSALKVTSRYFIQPDDSGERYIREKYLAPGLKYHPQFKPLPPNNFLIDTEIQVYANKVSFISLKEDEPVAVIIESSVFADSLRALLETLWQLV